MATTQKQQPGLLSQFGLPRHSPQEELRARAAGLYNAQVQGLPLNDSSLATMGARIGAGFGVKMSPPTLEESEQKQFELVERLNGMLQEFKTQHPNEWARLDTEDRALLYNRALAETAFDMGLNDIGAQAAQSFAEAQSAREKRDTELQKLGFETRREAANLVSDTRKAGSVGKLVRLEKPGHKPRDIEADDRSTIRQLIQDGWVSAERPTTSRVFNDPGVKKTMEKMAEGDVDWYMGIIENAEQATQNLPLYDILLDEFHAAHAGGGFKTGALSGARHGVGKLLEFVGAPVPEFIGDPASADRIEGVMSELAVDIANQMSRLTNMSITLVQNSLPNLAKTTTGNILIAEMQKFAAERAQAEAQFVEQWRQRNPTLYDDNGTHARMALTEWRKRPENNITDKRRYFERRIREEDRLGRRYSWRDVLEASADVGSDQQRRGEAQTQPPQALQGSTPEELNAAYEALPSGTLYVAPDGSTRRKP